MRYNLTIIERKCVFMKKIADDILNKVISSRPIISYKGSFGRVITIGGNEEYGGAIIMATNAAVHAGAGLVTCATSKINVTALHAQLPEAMFIDYTDTTKLNQAITKSNVVVIGPGLGTTAQSLAILKTTIAALSANHFIIVDGSAITLLAKNRNLLSQLKIANVIFTPHEMEWQRLSGIPIPNQDIKSNQSKQESLSANVVLKKYHTEIYHTNGSISQLSIGGPYMSTGGMGDTLTGIIAAFLCQFKQVSTSDRIDAAVYIHSAVASSLATQKYVVLPSDIIAELQHYMLISQKK